MKTRAYLFAFLFLVAGILPLCAQDKHQRALYNYRNDGEFNAFLDIDVDSITYSCIDTLGIEHDEVVVQEVWTSDSLYRIPLEAIDSIGFWAPKPEMASNIFYIRDYHASYTKSIEGKTIQLANTINRDSIPALGQVVLSATEKSPYEEGFAGKVVDVRYGSSGITIICEEVSIADIYKRLILVGKVSNDLESYPSHIRKKGRASEPWVNIEDYDVIPIELDKKEFPIGDLVKITSPTPKLTCTYSVYISELYYEGNVKLDLYHPDLTYNFTFSLDQLSKYSEFGKLFAATFSSDEELHEWLEEYKQKKIEEYQKEEDEYEKELSKQWFERSKIKIPIPLPTTSVLNLELEISPIVKAKGKVELDAEFKTDAWQSMTMKWKGFTPLKILTLGKGVPDIPVVNVSARQDPFKSAKLDIKAKGTLTFGFKTLLNVNFIHKDLIYLGLACDVALLEVGGELDVTVVDTERPEMNLYDRLKDTNLKISTYAKGYAEAGLTPYKFLSASTPKAELYSVEKIYYILPHFTEPVLPKYNNGHWEGKKPLSFFSSPSKDLFIPCKIGMRIEDEEGKPVKEYQSTKSYLDEIDWMYDYVALDVSDLPRGKNYKCYPTISYFGLEPFNAGPVHNIAMPLSLVASPSELTLPIGGSAVVGYYGGWDTFATVISGDDEVASIVNDGTTGARQIKVLGKKEGTSELQIEDRRTGEIVKVPITVTNGEEGNHEYVDLGLPSGTLWATCNVGATKPEEFGDKYAWGETEGKKEYTEENYLYKGQNLGSSICGTEHDVAHVRWGGNWQMPTRKQIIELESYCSVEEVVVNGLSGVKLIGPSGNSIFFPLEGGRWRNLSLWAGTPFDDEDRSYVLRVDDMGCSVYKSSRWQGNYVRPVEVSNMTPPNLIVTPEEFEFGVVKLGTDKSRALTVTNTSNASITVMMDGCSEYTSRFEVSDNKTEITLAPGQSKVYTVTAHGMSAGYEAKQVLYVVSESLDEDIEVAMSSIGDDDEPIIDVTELKMKVGESASVKVKSSYYSSIPDNEEIVELGGGGGPGGMGGPIDRHHPMSGYSLSEMTVKALKAGVVHITFTDHNTNHVSVLTVTITEV